MVQILVLTLWKYIGAGRLQTVAIYDTLSCDLVVNIGILDFDCAQSRLIGSLPLECSWFMDYYEVELYIFETQLWETLGTIFKKHDLFCRRLFGSWKRKGDFNMTY